MRTLSIAVLFLLSSAIYSESIAQVRNDRVVVNLRTIVIVRRGKIVKDFPEKKRATIKYPVVSGLGDARVLGRVQSVLQIRNAFGTSVVEYKRDNWLQEFCYEVNYNQNYILDITFTQDG